MTGHHDRSAFASATPPLDDWLRQTAQQHQRRGLSKTFVAILDDEPGRILGYYALTACEVLTETLPDNLNRKSPRKIPAVRLGRLAVDRTVQGRGLGAHLLMDAISRSRRVLDHIGIHALFVDAKDEAAAAFYAKYGFRPLPGDPLMLVLPLVGLR